MNKVFNKIALAFTGLAMAIGVGVALNNREYEPARATPTTYNFSSIPTKGWSTNGGSQTINSISWTYSSVTYISGANSKIQVGSKNSPQTSNWTIQTAISNFGSNKVVSAVSITGYTTNTTATYDISVGGQSKKSGSLTTSSATYSVNNLSISSGSIVITLKGSSGSAAMYLSNISVTYDDPPTYYSVTYNKNGGDGSNYVVENVVGGSTHNLVSWNDVRDTMSAPSGQQFKCWRVDSTERQPGYSITVNSAVTVYAVWEDIPSEPYINLSLTSGSPALKGTTVTVSAESGNLEGTGLTWSVSGGTINNQSTSNTSFNGTLASTGTITITATDNGGDTSSSVDVVVNAVTVQLDESAISIAQKKSATLTATVNGGSVTWGSNNPKVTVAADPENALKGIVTVAHDATVNSTATITATSTLDNTVHPTCTVTVSENPFASFTKLTATNQVTTDAIYALTNEETYWTGSSVSSSQIASVTAKANLGYFKLETATGGYYLRFVTQNSYGVWVPGSYINNSSGTGLSTGDSGSSVWVGGADGSNGIMLQNSSNDNRFLGWQKNTTTNAKAFSTTNLHAGDNNTPLYLYSVPYNKLETFAVSNQTRTFTAGDPFSLGNSAVLTAHYSIAGDTTNLDLTNGSVTYKINNVAVTTDTVLNHDDHNGKAVVITYTDASGAKANTASYTITVNYKPAEGLTLNQNSAGLSIGGKVVLTASVTDQYADPDGVTWTSSVAGVVSLSASSGTRTITVTGVADGTTVITATSGSQSDTCTITVDSTPILNLKDSGGNTINNTTIEGATGDSLVSIYAVTENITSPVYEWDNEDDSVVTIDFEDDLCIVEYVGGGTSDVTITVGELSQKVTFSVTQSAMTVLTLSNSASDAKLYTGDYDHTLTLTPSVTVVGNATSVINWSSSNTNVATVSSASTTAPTGITVTGVGAGTATITAASAYTPSKTATFEVTVAADGVTALSWTKRALFDGTVITIFPGVTTLGDVIEANGGLGTFTPTWISGKPDTPTFGTGDHNVHIAFYDTSTPSSENTPLSESYVFQNSDSGKYVVAFYEGKNSISNKQITVQHWRSVEETLTGGAIYDFADFTALSKDGINEAYDSDNSTLDSIANFSSSSCFRESTVGSWSIRMASGSNNGSATFTFDSTITITKVDVEFVGYNNDSSCALTVKSGTVSTSYTAEYSYGNDNWESTTHTFDVSGSGASNVVEFSAVKNKRVVVMKATFYAEVTSEIGRDADAIAVENFVDTYLHMTDYTEQQGWCSDETHHYYSTAKTAYNNLTTHQKEIFNSVNISNNAYAAECARLNAWAKANGDSINSTTLALGKAKNFMSIFGDLADSSNSSLIIIIISVISASAIGGYFFLRKRKEQ